MGVRGWGRAFGASSKDRGIGVFLSWLGCLGDAKVWCDGFQFSTDVI